jgi:hypothetical protein
VKHLSRDSLLARLLASPTNIRRWSGGSYKRRFVYAELRILITARGASYTVYNLVYKSIMMYAKFQHPQYTKQVIRGGSYTVYRLVYISTMKCAILKHGSD